jgi:hypothetical protein
MATGDADATADDAATADDGLRGPASSCRGCKGCRIVQEGRFIYEEYPPSSCTVM